jgi:hypothetical protein
MLYIKHVVCAQYELSVSMAVLKIIKWKSADNARKTYAYVMQMFL